MVVNYLNKSAKNIKTEKLQYPLKSLPSQKHMEKSGEDCIIYLAVPSIVFYIEYEEYKRSLKSNSPNCEFSVPVRIIDSVRHTVAHQS